MAGSRAEVLSLRNYLMRLSAGWVVEESPLRYSAPNDSVNAKQTEEGWRRLHGFKAAGGSLLFVYPLLVRRSLSISPTPSTSSVSRQPTLTCLPENFEH